MHDMQQERTVGRSDLMTFLPSCDVLNLFYAVSTWISAGVSVMVFAILLTIIYGIIYA